MTGFLDVVALLDHAVGGPASHVGYHGAFWRGVTRDQFVNTPTYRGVKPIIVGDGEASGIIQALRGTGPFVNIFPRMPPFTPAMSDEDIATITNWIDENCPEQSATHAQEETMAIKVLLIEDHSKFGKLLKQWAISGGQPATVDELEIKLTAEGVAFKWPNGKPSKKQIDYTFLDNERLTIAMPTKEMIEEGEELAGTQTPDGSYPLPGDYDKVYVNPVRKTSADFGPGEWDEIYAARFGDYTIAKCM